MLEYTSFTIPLIFARALGLMIHCIKAMSRGISGSKQVLKFADTSNRGRVCLSSQMDKAILNLQNVPFKYRQVSCRLLLAVRTSTVAAALKK